MKSLSRVLGLSLAALLVAAPNVFAADEDLGELTTKKPARKMSAAEEENNDPARKGPILGLGAVYAMQNFGNVGLSDIEDSGAYNAHVGYRFNKWYSMDLQVERYQEFDSGTPGDINGWAIGLNNKAYILHGRFQPWVQVGINYLDMETSGIPGNLEKTDDGAAMRFGGGLDVYATNKVVVVADISYMLGLGEVDDYDIIAFSLGFAYRP